MGTTRLRVSSLLTLHTGEQADQDSNPGLTLNPCTLFCLWVRNHFPITQGGYCQKTIRMDPGIGSAEQTHKKRLGTRHEAENI